MVEDGFAEGGEGLRVSGGCLPLGGGPYAVGEEVVGEELAAHGGSRIGSTHVDDADRDLAGLLGGQGGLQALLLDSEQEANSRTVRLRPECGRRTGRCNRVWSALGHTAYTSGDNVAPEQRWGVPRCSRAARQQATPVHRVSSAACRQRREWPVRQSMRNYRLCPWRLSCFPVGRRAYGPLLVSRGCRHVLSAPVSNRKGTISLIFRRG